MRNDGTTKQSPRWHLVYFSLAAFDILTVIAALFLSASILDIYVESVDESREWANRAADLSDLSLALVGVNAPGNDVFESNNVVLEKENLASAHHRFEDLYRKIVADFNSLNEKGLVQDMTKKLENVYQLEKNIVNEANVIFDLYEQGRQAEAGNFMAAC